jgi:hypothetical protein
MSNPTPTQLAQRIAELPPKPDAFDIWHETDDDCGAWARPSRPVYDSKQMDAYAIAAQDKYAAPLIERIKELEAVLREAREALQFANDSPGGGISDTIWMMHRPETLFDFLDAALATSKGDRAQAVAELERKNAELFDTLRHLVHNIKATGKRLDLGIAMTRAEAAISATSQGGQQK